MRRLGAFPGDSFERIMDGALPNPEMSRKFSLRNQPIRIALSHGLNVSFGQLGLRSVTAMVDSVLFRAISNIFFLGSNKKMRWVDTRTIVASVANNHSKRNFSNKKTVSVAVRQNNPLVFQLPSSGVKCAISCTGEEISSPEPAIGCFTDLGNKPFCFSERFHCHQQDYQKGNS